MLLVCCILGAISFRILSYSERNRFRELTSLDNIHDYASSFSNEGIALHYTERKWTRIGPGLVEPPDPYHLPLRPFFTHDRIYERWVSADGFHEVERLADSEGTLIGERLKAGDSLAVYDAINDISFRVQYEDSDFDSRPDTWSRGELSRIAESAWGGKAFLVRFDESEIDVRSFFSEHLDPAAPTPYISDLKFGQVRFVWVVDAATELPISKQLVAITESGEIVLQSSVRTKPEVVKVNDLTFEWGDFVMEDAKTSYRIWESIPRSAAQAAMLAQREGRINDGRTDPAEVAALTGHSIYLLDIERLRESHLNLRYRGIYPRHSIQCYRDRLAYNPTTCQDGLVIIEYVSDDLADIWVIVAVGLTSDVVPRLRGALPPWASSKLTEVSIGGEVLDAWLLVYPEERNMQSAILEQDGVFVQIDGYGISAEQLVELITSLQVVRADT